MGGSPASNPLPTPTGRARPPGCRHRRKAGSAALRDKQARHIASLVRSASALRRWRVFRVGDVLAPADGAALVVDFLHRDVGHEAVGGRTVPVVLAGLEEDPVAGPDDLDLPAAPLAEAEALG